jgi:glycosyltransferase involved in cell wall biosynthesis
MRIGINTLFLVPGDVGGTEVYLRENLKEMVQANTGDTFILFTTLDNDHCLRHDFAGCGNVKFVRLPLNASIRPLRIIAEQTLLPWKVSHEKIDVLWSPGYTAILISPCPQVVTIHDLQYKSHPEDLGLLERITLDFLVRNGCKKCASIIAVSNFSRSEIVRHDFAPEQKIHVVHEGVDPAFGEPTNTDVSSIVGIPPNIPYILCVAHTYPHKNVHLLVQAFALLIEEIPHHLLLVGKARRGEDKVAESLASVAHRQRVHRVDSISYDQLKAVYQGADLFVLPSEYEGFGLPVLEALLAGVPAITIRKASLPEVGGDCAIYVEENMPRNLAATIRYLCDLPVEERAHLIQRGKEWARDFSWKQSAEGTLKVLKQQTG